MRFYARRSLTLPQQAMSNDKPKKRLHFIFEVFYKAIAYNAIIEVAIACILNFMGIFKLKFFYGCVNYQLCSCSSNNR
ncbi:hypothetical protein LC605_03110 [Nostoc sp. CHAB 5836]|uniref:hypothetical protein n=1 Tax=Nostoc sp. CHAB 5836 TaxID=2780404 RepID=UPI001E630468|nr:hypothetical protein [Nostoc sp. CHAB 5836]MCC5614081.1 hypothetical protein [Nostoc sp. CHAB 5836]